MYLGILGNIFLNLVVSWYPVTNLFNEGLKNEFKLLKYILDSNKYLAYHLPYLRFQKIFCYPFDPAQYIKLHLS